MRYSRPQNPNPLAAPDKDALLAEYYSHYKQVYLESPDALNVKILRSSLADAVDQILSSIQTEAKSLAARDDGIRDFLAQNPPPGRMKSLLPDDFRAFCLLLNAVKQALSAEQNATDRYLLGGTARQRCRDMAKVCMITGETLSEAPDLHHPVRDGRPPIPLSKKGHAILEKQAPGLGDDDAVTSALKPIRDAGHFSWHMLRRGCEQLLTMPVKGGTAASNASAKTFANKAIKATGLDARALLTWLDARGQTPTSGQPP